VRRGWWEAAAACEPRTSEAARLTACTACVRRAAAAGGGIAGAPRKTPAAWVRTSGRGLARLGQCAAMAARGPRTGAAVRLSACAARVGRAREQGAIREGLRASTARHSRRRRDGRRRGQRGRSGLRRCAPGTRRNSRGTARGYRAAQPAAALRAATRQAGQEWAATSGGEAKSERSKREERPAERRWHTYGEANNERARREERPRPGHSTSMPCACCCCLLSLARASDLPLPPVSTCSLACSQCLFADLPLPQVSTCSLACPQCLLAAFFCTPLPFFPNHITNSLHVLPP